MLLQASNIIGKPIYSQQDDQEMGRVADIIIDPKNGDVVAFLISELWQKPKIVSEQDVIDVNQSGVLINAAESIMAPAEIIKVDEIMKRKIKLIGSKVITESKQKLGVAEDFVIETSTGQIIKLYVKNGLLSPSLILPTDKIVNIEKNLVIFSDDVLNPESAMPQVA